MLYSLVEFFLTFSIVMGQIIRIPIGTHGGMTMLDITIMILVLIGILRLKMLPNSAPDFIKAALIFTLIALISLFLTPLPLSAFEYFTSFSYTIRFSLFILLAWLIYLKAFPNINVYSVLKTSGLGLAILGLLQFIFLPNLSFLLPNGWDPHYFRTVSTFLDPNFTGAYFVLTLLVISPKNFYIKFAIVFLALLTTFSRSSYLMFLISGLVYGILKKSRPLILSTIVLFLILLLGFQIYTQLVANPRNIDREKSASLRMDTWQQGWTIFQRSPFLGVGFNAYRYGLREYQLGEEQFINSHGASTNDSSLLHATATTGIVGLVSFLFFLLILLKRGLKNVILTAGLLGLIAHSFFANSLFYPPILLWVILFSTNPKN